MRGRVGRERSAQLQNLADQHQARGLGGVGVGVGGRLGLEQDEAPLVVECLVPHGGRGYRRGRGLPGGAGRSEAVGWVVGGGR